MGLIMLILLGLNSYSAKTAGVALGMVIFRIKNYPPGEAGGIAKFSSYSAGVAGVAVGMVISV